MRLSSSLSHVFTIVLIFDRALSCFNAGGAGGGGAPGNAEALIEQYLGSQAAQPNVDQTAWSDEFIKEALELDCDFHDVTTCRWKNLEENSQLDTTNWYLFEKTNNKRWPDLLKPDGGKGTPKVGDRFLLTGAQGDKKEMAVWHSAPIKCMEKPGVLQFQFWFYGDVEARVLLLDVKTLKDKDLVATCQSKADGVCKIAIKPQEEPFIIGIQAHRMKNAVYILDKIRFDAELGEQCEGGLPDLGTEQEEFKSKAKGKPIDKDKDLKCPDFKGACRWRPLEAGERSRRKRAAADDKPPPEPVWKVHKEGADVDKELWKSVVRSEQTPSGPFLAVESKGGVARLLSDPVECQVNPGYLTFNSWVSDGTTMELCIVDMATLEPIDDCVPLRQQDDPAQEVEISSDAAQTAAIAYMFVVSGWNNGEGGLAAVDEIKYEADMCEEEEGGDENPTNPEGKKTDLYSPLFPNGPTDDVAKGKELNCGMDNFDDKENECFWSVNKASRAKRAANGAPWYWMEKPDKKKLKQLTDTKEKPDGAAGYYKFTDSSGTPAELISNRVQCINGGARLKYKFWVSDGVVTEACLQYESGERKCIESEETESPGPAVCDWEQADLLQPFRLVISAHVHQPGFVIIDDIKFIGDVCEPETKSVDETAPPEPEVDPCDALTVSFDDGADDMMWMEYDKWNENHAPLIVTDGVIGKYRHIELRDGESGQYAGVELDRRKWRTVLESPPFSLESTGRRYFSFFQHRSTRGSEIWLCKDEPPEFDSREYVTNTDACEQLAGPDIKLRQAQKGKRVGTVLDKDTKRVYILLSQPLVETYGECTIIVDNFMLHKGRKKSSKPDCDPPFAALQTRR